MNFTAVLFPSRILQQCFFPPVNESWFFVSYLGSANGSEACSPINGTDRFALDIKSNQ
jgi:hypothetical protein